MQIVPALVRSAGLREYMCRGKRWRRAIALTEFSGWDPYGILGYVIPPIVAFLFLAWEIGRWRMRRKYPLQRVDARPS